ncbi:amino acid ABC transporter permease [Leuconostoc gelidum]|uniref:Amino acid ABC transporter permease n=1 Tax=Leuconostoc gelidum subsp. gelidum TaxID=1607839 RepID=A0AB35FZ00_LEUGE|nr:amino acid ABC transporter permease [Leuconostoc gelidum]AFS39490.1 L-cystine permease [Leuconostoc gelidum JB7]MBZ5965050.1 amino acid ABC transporter permease [Leuconostoc gelidum subsp. gelidum]MBZ5974385.1 amino acid ABC transporter permease [Leuconostoc gelidum subsp. gelidum]MBZ5977224.1 amino acid ABC transporter permease [Leuconostoc gelidum subsp. gelidum]MBZ5985712.1 amino acid ABC transporter permease [Leuconostoc gelidum subsp. gelidum]
MNSFFQPHLIWQYFPDVLSALPVTLLLTLVSTIIGVIVGAGIAYVRMENTPFLKQIAAVFTSFIRGTPILIQMFLVYYGLPFFLGYVGIDADDVNALVYLFITYGLNMAAFLSEIIRAALESVPATQREAALTSGYTKRQMYFKIIFPQAVIIAMPSFATMVISLLQDTSLAFTIGVIDVVGKAKALGTATFHTVEAYISAMIIFIILSFILERLFRWIEKRSNYSSRQMPIVATNPVIPVIETPKTS